MKIMKERKKKVASIKLEINKLDALPREGGLDI
jgi:hypothetical protein